MAYEWCSVICKNYQSLGGWKSLLLVCLEIGFRRLDSRRPFIEAGLPHTEHHRKLVDVVFESRKSEAIADLLRAWTTTDHSFGPAAPALVGLCTAHLVGLHNLVPFSSRLRLLVIRSVELIGYKGFKGVGVEGFTDLLNHLSVTVEDMDNKFHWVIILLDFLQSPKGVQHLSRWYWKLLVELVISIPCTWPLRYELRVAYSPQITTSLTETQEWGKLECWMGIVWMLWPPGPGRMTEEDFDRTMPLLFHQRPGAAQNLKQWMDRWSQICNMYVPESFQRICKQAHEAARLNAQ